MPLLTRLPFPRSLAALLALPASLLSGATGDPVFSSSLPDQALTAGGAPATLDLSESVGLEDVSQTVVRIDTVLGSFLIELFEEQTPVTTENFLTYAGDGDYDGSFFHRLDPGFVLQGGGFTVEGTVVTQIPTNDPIANEPGISNTRGTIAMAKLGDDPDSATSQWFVNLGDNRENLDNQNGGFTVFAQVLGDGMSVVDAIEDLPTFRFDGPFGELPLRDFSQGSDLAQANFIILNRVAAVPVLPDEADGPAAMSVSASSSVPGVATASVTGATLTVTPVAAGSATITVTLEDPTGTTTTESSFAVTVAGGDAFGPFPVAATTLFSGGWRVTDGFGLYRILDDPWIYHQTLGDAFVQGTDPDGFFLFVPGLGWCFTSLDAFPYLYSYSRQSWLFHDTRRIDGPWLYDFQQSAWVRLGD